MKTLNRCLMGLTLVLGLLMVSRSVEAGSLPRSPKETFVTPYSVLGSTVTGSTFTQTTTQYPGAVYQVILATGASNEYVIMFDSNSCVGLTALTSSFTAPAKALSTRLFYVGASSGTSYGFDPPIVFFQGLCVYDSAITGQAQITYELGRGLSGN